MLTFIKPGFWWDPNLSTVFCGERLVDIRVSQRRGRFKKNGTLQGRIQSERRLNGKANCLLLHTRYQYSFFPLHYCSVNWKLYLRDIFFIKTVKNLKVKILAKLRVNLLNHTNVPRIWHLLKMQIYLHSSASEKMGSWVRISLVQQLRNGFLFAISSFYLSQ